jgi:hypothetical protein
MPDIHPPWTRPTLRPATGSAAPAEGEPRVPSRYRDGESRRAVARDAVTLAVGCFGVRRARSGRRCSRGVAASTRARTRRPAEKGVEPDFTGMVGEQALIVPAWVRHLGEQIVRGRFPLERVNGVEQVNGVASTTGANADRREPPASVGATPVESRFASPTEHSTDPTAQVRRRARRRQWLRLERPATATSSRTVTLMDHQ